MGSSTLTKEELISRHRVSYVGRLRDAERPATVGTCVDKPSQHDAVVMEEPWQVGARNLRHSYLRWPPGRGKCSRASWLVDELPR